MQRLISYRLCRFLFLCAVLSACGDPPVVPPAEAPRIVSLSPQTTAVVRHLGRVSWLTGVDAGSRALFGLSGVAVYDDPGDVGALLAAGPTLIVGVEDPGWRPVYDALGAGGLSVRVYDACTVIAVFAMYREIGDLLGETENAVALVRSLSGDLARISGATYGLPRPAAIVIAEAHPTRVAAGIGLVGDMLEIGGGEHVLELAGPPCARLGLEALGPQEAAVVLDARTDTDDLAIVNDALSGGTARAVVVADFMEHLQKLELQEAATLVRARLFPEETEFQR